MKKGVLCVLAILLVSLMSVASFAQPSARDPMSYKVGYRVGYYDSMNNMPSFPAVLHSKANWLSIARRAGFSLYDKERKMYYFFINKVSRNDFEVGYRHGYDDSKRGNTALYTESDVFTDQLVTKRTSFKGLSADLAPIVAAPSSRKLKSDLARSYTKIHATSYQFGYDVGLSDKAIGFIRPHYYLAGSLPKTILGRKYTEKELESVRKQHFLVGYRHAVLGITSRLERDAGYSFTGFAAPTPKGDFSRRLGSVVGTTKIYDAAALNKAAIDRQQKRQIVYRGYTKKVEPVAEEPVAEEPVAEPVAEEAPAEETAEASE